MRLPTPEPLILMEDNHLIVIRKPAGMPSQGDETGDLSALDWVKNHLKIKYQKPGEVFTALVHRLDRPVGGVMIFGKTSKAAKRLTEQFQTKTIQKTYHAVTEKIPAEPSGTLTHYLKKLPGKNIVRAYQKPVHDTKVAVLDYKTLQDDGRRAFLEIHPQTGRQHQIRVQLSAIGCTIVGDVKYGKSDFLPDGSIALWAFRLELEHPISKKKLTFETLPEQQFPWEGWN